VPKQETVRLAAEARGVCQAIVKRLKGTAAQVTRAPRLRQAEADGPAWSAGKMAEADACRGQTGATVRPRGGPAGVAVARARPKRATAPPPPHAGGRRRRPGEREAVRHTACGRRALGLATARRRLGGGGGGGGAGSRDGPPDAKKTGRTTRQIADGVLPPAPEAAGVAGRDEGRAPSAKVDAPPPPRAGQGRATGPGVAGDARADRGHAAAWHAGRGRGRPPRHGAPVAGRRTVVGLATGDRPCASYPSRLGARSRPVAGDTLGGGRAGDTGGRSPQHASPRGVLRSVPPRASAGLCQAA
jgi:hypothetical protein